MPRGMSSDMGLLSPAPRPRAVPSVPVGGCVHGAGAGRQARAGVCVPTPTPKLLDPQCSGGPCFGRCPEDLCWACLSLWQWGLAAFGAMGTVVFSWAWTSRVRPLRPSYEPGLTGEAEAGSGAS